jgi:hypothetical protein
VFVLSLSWQMIVCRSGISNERFFPAGFVDPSHPADSAVLHPTAGPASLLVTAAKRRHARQQKRQTAGTKPAGVRHSGGKQHQQRDGSSRGGGSAGANPAGRDGRSCSSPSSFCWRPHCAGCTCRIQTLTEAGLWPIENAGECTFFSPVAAATGESNADQAVTWNLL